MASAVPVPVPETSSSDAATFASAKAAREAVARYREAHTTPRFAPAPVPHFYVPTASGAPRVLGGLHAHLERTLWPGWVAVSTKRSGSNAAVGRLVDAQLAEWATTGTITLKGRTRKPHRFTRAVQALLTQESCEAVAAQVPVCAGHVATALDLVVWCARTGELEYWEIKTGTDKGGKTRKHGKMLAPLDGVWSNPHNHFLVQAAWGHAAACACGLPLARARVVLANTTSDVAKASTVPAAIQAHIPALVAAPPKASI